MPPATAWGWNPQPLAAGSAYAQGYLRRDAAFTDCPGTEAATLGKTSSARGVGLKHFAKVFGEFEIETVGSVK